MKIYAKEKFFTHANSHLICVNNFERRRIDCIKKVVVDSLTLTHTHTIDCVGKMVYVLDWIGKSTKSTLMGNLSENFLMNLCGQFHTHVHATVMIIAIFMSYRMWSPTSHTLLTHCETRLILFVLCKERG